MYLFFLLAFPLSYLCFSAWFVPVAERSGVHRLFLRGFILGLPSVALWVIARPLFAPRWGSLLVALMFMLRYWILPFGLCIGSYALSRGLSGLRRGQDFQRFVGFLCGFMAVFAFAFAIEAWGEKNVAYSLFLPALLLSSGMAVPLPLEEAVKEGMPYALKWILAMVAGSFAAALCVSLFFLRLEWLGLVLSLCFMGGAGFVGMRRLARG